MQRWLGIGVGAGRLVAEGFGGRSGLSVVARWWMTGGIGGWIFSRYVGDVLVGIRRAGSSQVNYGVIDRLGGMGARARAGRTMTV